MAPLPPESTARFYFDYADGINQHTLVMRVGPGADATGAAGYFEAFFDALSAVLYAITVVGMRVSSDNSNITNPVPYGGAASFGTGVMPGANAPRELRFMGRSTDGRRVSASVYGYNGSTPNTYRLTSGDVSQVLDAIVLLETASAAGYFLTISQQDPVWKPYASFNFNSYWEREQRP